MAVAITKRIKRLSSSLRWVISMDHRGCRDRPRAGPWSRRCNCRLPAADWGRGPDIGFRAHLGRRLARGALDRVAALCASYLDGLFLCHHRGGCCSHSVPLDPCRCAQSSCAQPSGRSAVAGGLVPAQPRALHRSRPQTRVGVKKKAGHKGRPFRFESKSGQLQPVVAPQFRHL